MSEEQVTPTPENPIPDVDDIKPMIPNPAWADENEVPVASASNEGQSLVSTKKYVKGAVIVPEQTVTLDDECCAQPSNVNMALFSEGTRCIANIDEEEYSGIVEIVEGSPILCLVIGSIELWINDVDELWYWNDNLNEGDESTIALYVAEPVYSWEPDPYAGYDIVVKTDKEIDDNTLTENDLHLIRGDYNSCIPKIKNGIPINAVFYKHNIGTSSWGIRTYFIACSYSTHAYGDYVEMSVMYKTMNDIAYKNIYLTESGFALSV